MLCLNNRCSTVRLVKCYNFDLSKIRELEQHLKTVRKREAKAREELDVLRNAQKQNKYVSDDKCEQLQIDNAQLQDKLSEVSIIYRALFNV